MQGRCSAPLWTFSASVSGLRSGSQARPVGLKRLVAGGEGRGGEGREPDSGAFSFQCPTSAQCQQPVHSQEVKRLTSTGTPKGKNQTGSPMQFM